jgi:hypothetical protein
MFEELLQGTVALTIGIIFISCLCVFGVIAFSYLLYFIFARSKRKKAEALLETGQQGEATVLSLEDTGVKINDNPRVRIGLEVRLEGYPQYRVEKTTTIPLIRLSQVQVGSQIAIIADPSDPSNPDKVGLLLK